MIHVALSEDGTVMFRYGFIYYHMNREMHRMAGPEAQEVLEYALQSEIMMTEMLYVRRNGRINELFRVASPDCAGL